MRIACLCPTYGRPQSLIENAIACFLSQYHKEKGLYILDDTPRFQEHNPVPWNSDDLITYICTNTRTPSLPCKYNRLCERLTESCPGHQRIGLTPDVVAVWDDDDVYLPWHLTAIDHHLTYSGREWCKPGEVWSTYTGIPQRERSDGRFHGSIAMKWECLERAGGWPESKRCGYDQQMMDRLEHKCGPFANTLLPAKLLDGPEIIVSHHFPIPSYVFRWADTGAAHCQTIPEGDDWYDRVIPQNTDPLGDIVPRFDKSAKMIFTALGVPVPVI